MKVLAMKDATGRLASLSSREGQLPWRDLVFMALLVGLTFLV